MHLGFDEKDDETHVELMHRARVVQHACFYNYVYCTNRAQLLFRDWMSEKTKNLYVNHRNLFTDILWCFSFICNKFPFVFFAFYVHRINPNLKDVIYCTALREGSYEEWYFAYNRYLETSSASEKELILTALGCTTKPWLLAKYELIFILNTHSIQSTQRPFLFFCFCFSHSRIDI